MIKLLRFTNILPISLVIIAIIWMFWMRPNVGLFALATGFLIVNFIINLFMAHSFKEKENNGEIHIFYDRNTKPAILRWAIITISALILFLFVFDTTQIEIWFWLTFLLTKGIENLTKINDWTVIIENNAVYEKSFWIKPIPLSEITKMHINNQAELEIITEKGMTPFKLESGISVNVRDKIEAIKAEKNHVYA